MRFIKICNDRLSITRTLTHKEHIKSFCNYFWRFSPTINYYMFVIKIAGPCNVWEPLPVSIISIRRKVLTRQKSYYITQFYLLPTLHAHAVFSAPVSGELAGEGLVEDGGFAGFGGGEGLLGFFFGLVKFGEEAFDVVDDALLGF